MSGASGVTFRVEATAQDETAVRGIVASTGFFSPAEIEVAAELVRERLLKGPESGYHFVFAERAGRCVGYACFGPIPCTVASFDLYWIAVHADSRGEGLGRAVLRRAEREIARLGGRRIYAETSSRLQYEPTRAFYERCGFVRHATLPDFYDEGDGKVIYFKPAPPSEALA